MTFSSKPFLSIVALTACLLLLSLLPLKHQPEVAAEPLCVREFVATHPGVLIDSTSYFPHSTKCGGCHGKDSSGNALVDAEGQDINMYDDWRAGIMANAAKDPFWKAKVRHEVLVNPSHSLDLQTKCTSCHAPMGHYTALYNGQTHYLLDDLFSDTLGMDGVSCGACHQIKAPAPEILFSGHLNYDTTYVQYGPYENPFFPPMANFVGFMPVFSKHIGKSELCASCHSLITKTVDLEGNYTGGTFVEQATYHEWLNSRYMADSISCQGCHMPQITDPVIISANYMFLEGRSPYGLHELVGGNSHMLKIMKNYRDVLGIRAGADHQDLALQATLKMLKENALDLQVDQFFKDQNGLRVRAQLKNKSGHKLPSGYPARRMFVELILTDVQTGDTLFHSGKQSENFELVQEDPTFEPHYDTVFFEDQIPIYEMVVGDINGEVTTLLERAATALKDNRIPPEGFTTAHPSYDSTRIAGRALQDENFNNKGLPGQEGSGSDYLHYYLNFQGYNGEMTGKMTVYYQSIPPKWVKPLFEFEDSLINSFEMMYTAVKPEPVVIATTNLDTIAVEFTSSNQNPLDQSGIVIYPNPIDHQLWWHGPSGMEFKELSVFSQAGKKVLHFYEPQPGLYLPLRAGYYILQWKTSRGVFSNKVVKF